MKALWLHQLKSLLETDDFRRWYADFNNHHVQHEHAKREAEQVEEQLVTERLRADRFVHKAESLVFTAGDYENRVSEAAAETLSQENESFQALNAFETYRLICSEAWGRVSAGELRIDTLERSLAERRSRSANDPDLRKIEAELERLRAEQRSLADAHRDAEKKRSALWDQVETSWAKILVTGMKRAEYEARARRLRAEAERLYGDGEKANATVKALEARAQVLKGQIQTASQKRHALLGEAQRAFDCFAVEEFLYWPRRENDKLAFCVPLFDIPHGFNRPLTALDLLQVDRTRGVEELEPARE